jgi:hypothetical protein
MGKSNTQKPLDRQASISKGNRYNIMIPDLGGGLEIKKAARPKFIEGRAVIKTIRKIISYQGRCDSCH